MPSHGHVPQHRFDDPFEREAHDLYDDLRHSRFVPALGTLNITLTDLIKAHFNPSDQLRIRVEKGRIKEFNRLLVKASSQDLRKKIRGPHDIFKYLTDVVGTRITCNVTSDVDRVIEAVEFAERTPSGRKKRKPSLRISKTRGSRDYIRSPKPSGYRAYHIFVEIDVPSEGQLKPVLCEVQIRTLLQDAWGELTHEDTYKPGMRVPTIVASLSKRLATALAVMDEIAQDIRDELDRTVQKSSVPVPAQANAQALVIVGSPSEQAKGEPSMLAYKPGETVLGEVVYVSWDYALIQLPSGHTGILHWTKVGEAEPKYVDVRDYVSAGKTVKVEVLKVAQEGKRIELGLVRAPLAPTGGSDPPSSGK